MDEQQNDSPRPENPRRRKRSQLQVFKESYLPVAIACLALILIIVFIVGSAVRKSQRKRIDREASIQASIALEQKEQQEKAEVDRLLAEAEALAEGYDFDGAIAKLDSFTGDLYKYPEIYDRREAYLQEKEKIVAWDDPSQITNLSFQLLIADPSRAFKDKTYGSSYNKNFITTEEFSKILSQLYDNGYILIRLTDMITTQTGEDGQTVYAPKTLYLPVGKKPLILTQTQVNYYTYMVDGNGDKLPDKDGDGFASRLVLDDDGHITCQMVNTSGDVVTGDYDLVPILDKFVDAHPDFSYNGAKAILAVTGYDGLFGYRTNPGARATFGDEEYSRQISGAEEIANALRADGYTLACYTYDNIAYGDRGTSELQADLSRWNTEVVPILGALDIMVYARNSDISAGTGAYSGDKYNAMANAGFRYYLGFCTGATRWTTLESDHVRQGRLMVSGSNLAYHADWFSGIFDASTVLDTTRGTIPS